MANAVTSLLDACLWPRGERGDTWMVVDGARDRRIFPFLLESYLTRSCLYTDAPGEMEVVAPYLVQLPRDDPSSRRLISRAWGNAWGIFLKCDLGLDQLRRHLRRFLVVRQPDGGRMLFRYYDPRVLRVYLPTCIEDELDAVFGPIESFWAEDDSAAHALEFRFEKRALVQKRVPVC